MRLFRRAIFWLHLIVGVAVGLIVGVMATTGVLLTYERQIVAFADRRALPPVSSGTPLGPEALLARLPGRPTALSVSPEPGAPVTVSYGRERTRFVDPATGAVLGEGNRGVRAFFGSVTDLHRWLGAGGPLRPVGRSVTGASNLGFALLVVSGLVLWWPRSWRGLRAVVWFRRTRSAQARDFNWHHVVGFWLALPLLVVIVSGVVISYPWASGWVYRLSGESPPSRQTPAARPDPPAVESAPSWTGLDALWHRTDSASTGQTRTMTLPSATDSTVTITLDGGTGGQPQHRTRLVLNRATGATITREAFADLSPGRRRRAIFRFAHTGEIGGPVGQTLAGLASAGAALLVWTGLALAWRRWRRARTRRRTTHPVPVA